MSHKATNWAIQQRGLMPATKLVLWYLCDRHNPDFGCFPSQDQLAADAEISRASLNTHLEKLEIAGLIRRQRRMKSPASKNPPDMFWASRMISRPSRVQIFWTWKIAKAVSRFWQKPCPEFGH